MITKNMNRIASDFVHHIKLGINPKNSVIIKNGEHFYFYPYNEKKAFDKNVKIIDVFEIEQEKLSNLIGGVYELIIGDFPVGIKRVNWQINDKTIKIRQNFGFIYSVSRHLNHNGIGIFIVEPIMWSKEWKDFSNYLNNEGLFVNGIINTPSDAFSSYSSIRFVLLLVSKMDRHKLFIAELDDSSSIPDIIDNYLQNNSTGTLERGLLTDNKDFNGFDNFRLKKEIEKLNAYYKDYKEYQLIDVAEEITLGRYNQNLTEKENSIYLPKVGNSKVIWNINNATLKHQNYFQIVLNKSFVINKYAALFYQSDLGRTIIKSLFVGGIIQNITKQSLNQAILSIPSFKEQELIIDTHDKLERLEREVEAISQELSINPRNAGVIQQKIDGTLNDLSALTESDRVKAIIRKGESKTREYKHTLSLDVKRKTKEKYIEVEVLKTMTAFLNTEGGNLLIGVKDSGEITGIDLEVSKLYKNKDKYLLHFKNLIKHSIGEGFYPLIDYKIVEVDNINVLIVNCQESNDPCYLYGKDFFVRTNPATDRLEGPKLVEYINRHFNK